MTDKARIRELRVRLLRPRRQDRGTRWQHVIRFARTSHPLDVDALRRKAVEYGAAVGVMLRFRSPVDTPEHVAAFARLAARYALATLPADRGGSR